MCSVKVTKRKINKERYVRDKCRTRRKNKDREREREMYN